jgi:spore maturation protein CgeB
MKILFCALKYDYGMPERGLSFEYHNFYEPMSAMGHQVEMLDMGAIGRAGAPGSVDRGFLDAVTRSRPDLVFTFLAGDELSAQAIAEVTEAGIPTLNWFADDHWRFEDFTRRYARSFGWVATTARSALPKYTALGCRNVIKTQWAAAHDRYRPSGSPPAVDVSFVGQVYGDRRQVVEDLRRDGVPVQTWGTGWAVRRWHRVAGQRPPLRRLGGARWLHYAEASTRCSQEEMIEIFSSSRINLNFTEASQGGEPQIKGRTFEVPACGGFLLTGEAEDLESYFDLGREVVVFRDAAELRELTRYYLMHDSERRRIARAGYLRTVAEHTYHRRFAHIFGVMEL